MISGRAYFLFAIFQLRSLLSLSHFLKACKRFSQLLEASIFFAIFSIEKI